MNFVDSRQIHAKLGAAGWHGVLVSAGIDRKHLRDAHGPCPACGGKDRFRFDNKGNGSFFCSGCGAGDGFKLLMRVFGYGFSAAKSRVMELAGIDSGAGMPILVSRETEMEIAKPTRRVLNLLRETCKVEDCEPVISYLKSRILWPLPEGHKLRAHPSVEYYQDRLSIGRFPALIAPVTDVNGELVTVHVTYLTNGGEKLEAYEPRKILSKLEGRESCAIRLVPHGPVLGIAEGIETALSASRIHGLPVWAALNTSLLAKFIPPDVQQVVIFADRDIAGLDAAAQLGERLQGRVPFSIRTPKVKDWNDALRMP